MIRPWPASWAPIVVLGAMLAACADHRESPAIPNDVTYSIIEDNTGPGTARGLDVRLNKKVSEIVLGAIATQLRERDSARRERTHVLYYLPGMLADAGAWASAHFEPDLKVEIMGLTIEDERVLLDAATPDNRKIIGRWTDERPYAHQLTTLFESDSGYSIEERFKGGRVNTSKLIATESSTRRRFDPLERSAHGEYWVLDGREMLLYDDDGLFAALVRVD